MARRSGDQPPPYRLHKGTGQALVRVGNTITYLGPHGSPASLERYERFVREWRAERDREVATAEAQVNAKAADALAARRAASALAPAAERTFAEVMLLYADFAEGYYRKHGRPTSELGGIKQALRFLKPFGRDMVSALTPAVLKAAREAMLAGGLSRRTINQHAGRIKRFAAWLVENGHAPPSVYHGLLAVKGLRYGRTAAKESAPVPPADPAAVEATLSHLSPPVAAMVRFQLLTGCRPGEATLLRPGDLDRADDVWLYRPREHKTQHHEHGRVIPVGPLAQAVLRPLLEGRPNGAYVFRPAEAVTAVRAARTAARKTPESCGNRPGSNKRVKPRRQPGDHYTAASYGRAVAYALRKVNAARAEKGLPPLAHWHPNQLRHAKATAVRKAFGLEAAQVLLGHAKADVTQTYAERDLSLATKVAAETG